MHTPKTKNTYCKKCKQHTKQKVAQYKKGKDNKNAQGNRRYAAKQKGFGGQTKPILKRKAKQTKKITLRLECSACKQKTCKVLGRCKTFILGADASKKAGGPVY